ncbi:MAG: UDP-N-acetylglucosamine 2-epimerase [Chlorobiaceae bacterium]
MKKILLAAGPNSGALLLAPLYEALQKSDACNPLAVIAAVTGEAPVSRELAAGFNIGDDLLLLQLQDGSPAEQLASMMTGMEKIILAEQPDLVIACGAHNAAMGAAFSAAKLGVRVAAADSGLRSYDRSDSLEINRIVIDAIADLHFLSERSGEFNLINEGVDDEKVFFAGNLAIDSLVRLMEQANKLPPAGIAGIKPKKYALLLLGPEAKSARDLILRIVRELSLRIPVLMARTGTPDPAFSAIEGLVVIDHPGYLALLPLLRDAAMLLTDSEEMQPEATVMSVPCLTMMESTSRPATIEIGTNVLVGDDEEEIMAEIEGILKPGDHQHASLRSKIPEKWDGASASRIVAVLERVLQPS